MRFILWTSMKAVRFGFFFFIAMVLIRLLTLITFFYPDIYWISPLFAIIELLTSLNLDNAAIILVYIIYPSLFYVSWFIIYMFILISNTNRSIAKQRFLVLSILGVISLIMSVVGHILNYGYMTGKYDFSLLMTFSGISGILTIIFIIVILSLPNLRYLTYYKILRVGGFVLSYIFLAFIFLFSP